MKRFSPHLGPRLPIDCFNWILLSVKECERDSKSLMFIHSILEYISFQIDINFQLIWKPPFFFSNRSYNKIKIKLKYIILVVLLNEIGLICLIFKWIRIYSIWTRAKSKFWQNFIMGGKKILQIINLTSKSIDSNRKLFYLNFCLFILWRWLMLFFYSPLLIVDSILEIFYFLNINLPI